MNRFFRSALFPLIVIAAVVWLATMTLRGHGQKTEHKTLSQALTIIREQPNTISEAVVNPNKQELQLKLTDKRKITVHYPADTVLPALQNDLQKANRSTNGSSEVKKPIQDQLPVPFESYSTLFCCSRLVSAGAFWSLG